MDNQDQKNRQEEDMRISKMISEGGQGVQAYYFNNPENDQGISDERLAAKAMIDEGGLGAEFYYNKNEKIAKIDVENEGDYMN